MGKPSGTLWGRITCSYKKSVNFQKTCKCTLHEVFSSSSSNQRIYNVNSSKDYSKKYLAWLIENGFFSSKSKIVCAGCLEYANKKTSGESSCQSTSQHPNSDSDMSIDDCELNNEEFKSPEVKAMIDLLKNATIEENDCIELCLALGSYLNGKIFNDTKN